MGRKGKKRTWNVAFLHPDLGIGGAERLVVNSGKCLQDAGHKVTIYTAFHDPERSFKATRDGTLNVEVYGNFLPRSIFGKCMVLCAIMRNFWTGLRLVVSREKYDVIFVDQISHNIPLLRFATGRPKILFYCHFPDQLLTDRKSIFKRGYRWFVDAAEEYTTSMADGLLCNSKFTRGIMKKTFKIPTENISVLYPSVPIGETPPRPPPPPTMSNPKTKRKLLADAILFSLNRFERKKGHHLALKAFKILRDKGVRAYLIIAGGYDPRLKENVEYYEELKQLSAKLGLETAEAVTVKLENKPHKVRLWRNIPDLAKMDIYEKMRALLYTPVNEHFGIVPIEAMLSGRAVIACNSGGPLETVVNDETGFLLNPSPEAWAEKMELLCKNYDQAKRLGAAGYKRVKDEFSEEAFKEKLQQQIRWVLRREYNPRGRYLVSIILTIIAILSGIFGFFVSILN